MRRFCVNLFLVLVITTMSFSNVIAAGIPTNFPWVYNSTNSSLYNNPLSTKAGIGTKNPVGMLGISRYGTGSFITLQGNPNGGTWRLYGENSTSRIEFAFTDNASNHLWKILTLGVDGNVGVGCYNPDEKFAVDGGILAKAFKAQTAAGQPIWQFSPKNYGERFELSMKDASGSNHTSLITVDATGNVGIGVLDAEEKLEVNGRIKARELMAQLGAGQNTWKFCPGNDANFTLGRKNAAEVWKWDLIEFAENGNVGIGTTTLEAKLSVDGNLIAEEIATTKLSVDGDIFAEEITVALSEDWPDYVFEADYNLKSLDELEQYVSNNKHLPGIPNKNDVADGGINVGEISTKLLEKVEELTLYLIDLKKENNTLRERLDVLEGE